jgi:exonuclease III
LTALPTTLVSLNTQSFKNDIKTNNVHEWIQQSQHAIVALTQTQSPAKSSPQWNFPDHHVFEEPPVPKATNKGFKWGSAFLVRKGMATGHGRHPTKLESNPNS